MGRSSIVGDLASISGDIANALDAGMNLGEAKTVAEGDYAIVPDGANLVDLEPFKGMPRRIRQTNNFLALDSFTKYVAKWEDSGATEIFADHNSFKFKAVIDYHNPKVEGGWQASHCDHIAYYTAKMSDEWTAWSNISNRALAQAVFADFLEERAVDVVKPDGARVLETVLDLRAHIEGSFASKSVLSNGSREFAFTETVEQVTSKGIIKLPELMTLNIPIFDRGDKYKMEVRVRFRIEDAKLRFFIKIVDAPQIKDQVFFDLLAKIGKETKHMPLVAEVQ